MNEEARLVTSFKSIATMTGMKKQRGKRREQRGERGFGRGERRGEYVN